MCLGIKLLLICGRGRLHKIGVPGSAAAVRFGAVAAIALSEGKGRSCGSGVRPCHLEVTVGQFIVMPMLLFFFDCSQVGGVSIEIDEGFAS